jgi:hypothetical protein
MHGLNFIDVYGSIREIWLVPNLLLLIFCKICVSLFDNPRALRVHLERYDMGRILECLVRSKVIVDDPRQPPPTYTKFLRGYASNMAL